MNNTPTNIDEILKAAERYITDRSIGFLSVDGNSSKCLGSGTLLSFGKIRGVLTCAHVVEVIKRTPKVGVLLPENKNEMSKQFGILPLDEIDAIVLKGNGSDLDGPDLAFFALPEAIASTISAKRSFTNWGKQRDDRSNKILVSKKALSFLQGWIQEWDVETPIIESKVEKIFLHRGLINIGTTIPPVTSSDGYDYLDFKIDPSDGSDVPSSFGATSGGAVWKFVIKEIEDEKIEIEDIRLTGVAFYENQRSEQVISIRCHGPQSIFTKLWEVATLKWPHAFS